ncbi:ribonuclease P protein subunit p29 [Anoplophora glabripennis]|uniref:ribonuclease P protein subunit p29 n=1 Tax=Anoplophora glabripennis TaxID=217634 RepID=UPI00087436AA|nr:ribonuclease P protein subunit p29 [Anoplophora glabripennis]
MPSDIKKLVNSSLPGDILPGPSLNPEQSTTYIRKFLIQNIPQSDLGTLTTDLQWKFMLEKHSLRKKQKPKGKKTFLTRKQRLELGLLKLPKEGWSYASLEPLRDMWKEYMRQNLEIAKAPSCNDQEWNAVSAIVAKSELVGAEMTIIKSKVPSQVGMSGVVVLETKMTFQIVTPQSKLKTIIKTSSVFQFQLDNMRFVVYGKHIATRPHERSVKKIKCQMIPDL